MNIVCIPPQKLESSKNKKKSNKIDKNENFKKIKKTCSRICTKEDTCQIWWWSEHVKTEKIGDDELARQTDFIFYTGWFLVL